jgi:hypothetical protein
MFNEGGVARPLSLCFVGALTRELKTGVTCRDDYCIDSILVQARVKPRTIFT